MPLGTIGCCGTSDILRARARSFISASGSPRIDTEPLEGRRRPAIVSTSVVLPAPFGQITVGQMPGSKTNVTFEIRALEPARTLSLFTSTELIPQPADED